MISADVHARAPRLHPTFAELDILLRVTTILGQFGAGDGNRVHAAQEMSDTQPACIGLQLAGRCRGQCLASTVLTLALHILHKIQRSL